MVSLAALVGERMFFDGDSSSGVSGDLQNATRISLAMEGLWGMGGQYGSYAVAPAPHDAQPVADGQDRAVFETSLGRRAEANLAGLAERTGTLLQENRASVLAVGHALEFHKTITGQDVDAIINGTEGPVVDGRPYHTREFADTLESYPKQEMVAHRGRDRSMPRPAPAPVRETPAPISPRQRQAAHPRADR